MRLLWHWAYGRASVMLSLTTLMWAGNSVAGRMIAGEMSPMSVVTLRWLIVCGLLWASTGGQVVQWRATLLHARWRIVVMGLFGFTGFNALFYLAAYHTTAVNLTLLQSSIPAFVMVGAVLLFRAPIGAVQICGLAITFVSVALIATKGDLPNILQVSFNQGDVLILIACLFYSGYTLALRDRPKVPGLVFFSALAAVAFLSSLPLLAAEIAMGQAYWPSFKGCIILMFVAFGPSLLSQIFFMRGVELIGPGRAGIFTNLVPVFGAFLAVVILHEPFHLYHALALALGLSGIWLSEFAARKSA